MTFATADLCDAHGDGARVVAPILFDFGGVTAFSGAICTVRVTDDNLLVRAALKEPGDGRVLVVDGGGSLRAALFGDKAATLAIENGWAGVVVNGAVRDVRSLRSMAVGVRALATCPRPCTKKGEGARDVSVTFGGVTFSPGDRLYADEDGIVLIPRTT